MHSETECAIFAHSLVGILWKLMYFYEIPSGLQAEIAHWGLHWMYNTSVSQHKLTIGEHYQRTIVILPLSLPPLFPSSRAAQLRTVAVWIPATSYLLRTRPGI